MESDRKADFVPDYAAWARIEPVRRRAENPGVGGSIPSQPTIHFTRLPIMELSLQ